MCTVIHVYFIHVASITNLNSTLQFWKKKHICMLVYWELPVCFSFFWFGTRPWRSKNTKIPFLRCWRNHSPWNFCQNIQYSGYLVFYFLFTKTRDLLSVAVSHLISARIKAHFVHHDEIPEKDKSGRATREGRWEKITYHIHFYWSYLSAKQRRK